MHMKLLDAEHLANGTERQKQAFSAINRIRLLDQLREYSPVLAGSIPIDVDIEGSDLDVICSAANLEEFATDIEDKFGTFKGFELKHVAVNGKPTVIARFMADGLPIEVFTQTESVFTQAAVLHMLIEARLLSFAPAEARETIRTLKRQGLATEPAFAKCFEIEGDPYEELLKISRLTDREILGITHRLRFQVH